LLYLVRDVLLLLYVSTLLAIGFSPAIHWFERRRVGWLRTTLSRGAAILIFYVLCLAMIALILAVIVPPFVRQTRELWLAMPGYFNSGEQILIARGWLHWDWTWADVAKSVPSPELAVTGLVGAFESVLGALAALATIVVLPYYLLVEADALQDGFLRLLPADRRERFERVTDDVTLKVGAWLGSQMLLCLIIGALASLCMWLIGVPYFYVLGLLAGLGELVPVVGPLMAAVPAVIAGWSISTETMVVVAGYFALQQLFENYVLVPRIMQKHVGVSAVTVIVALLVGTELLGVVGALLAVPTAAIVQVLLHEYLHSEPS
ncbi:MAG TPA: AI-2E family transporter, partial [Vicinamibacterales bacterium]